MSDKAIKLIPLPGQFVQVQLGALKEIVNHQYEDGGVVQFDAHELERMDGSAAQFLLAVTKAQESDGPALVINANEILTNALTDMGLNDLISIEAPVEEKAA